MPKSTGEKVSITWSGAGGVHTLTIKWDDSIDQIAIYAYTDGATTQYTLTMEQCERLRAILDRHIPQSW